MGLDTVVDSGMNDELRDGGYNEGYRGAAPLRRDGAAIDELFEVLADGRRRRILTYLRDAERSVRVEELAKHVAISEATTGDVITENERERIRTSLCHVHLPKLVDAGLVAWQDPAERTAVHATSEGQSLPPHLSWLPDGVTVTEE